MYNGVSALQSHQTKINIIGNNIANVNTDGYKAGRVTFADQLAQTVQSATRGNGTTLGGTNPTQLGTGVRVGTIDILTQQGSLQATSKNTDLAVQGNGYFMLGDGASTVKYTRDGAFSVDQSGNIVQGSDGSYVLGWQAGADGKIDTTAQIGPGSHLSIPVGGLATTTPTSNVAFGGNLDAEAAIGAPSAGDFSRTVKIYDSLGTAHSLTMSFNKTAANTWNWRVSGDAALDAATGTTNQGSISFDANGQITGTPTGTVKLSTLASGAAPVSVAPNFAGISQVAGTSTVTPTTQDGFAPGSLLSFSIDQTGLITGAFDNGFTRSLGQLALADFPNPSGLERIGGNAFKTTVNSGAAKIGAAAGGTGLGKINSGYLEQSNVDLSTEFTNMIVTQRGFQANTKIITTVDQLLDDVINLKR